MEEANRRIEEWVRRGDDDIMLNLYNLDLTSLPESIYKLSSFKLSLKHLDLRNNKLTSLPERFSQLSSLKYLWLNNTNLTSLPESISQLSSLQQLTLASNNLTSLPESIGQHSYLRYIVLINNKLTSLPESFGKRSLLSLSLWLSDNKFLWHSNYLYNPNCNAWYNYKILIKLQRRQKNITKLKLRKLLLSKGLYNDIIGVVLKRI